MWEVLPWWLSGKESACQCRGWGFNPWVGKIPWRRKQHLTSVFLPGKSYGWRTMVGYSPQGCEELDTTGWLNNKLFKPPSLGYFALGSTSKLTDSPFCNLYLLLPCPNWSSLLSLTSQVFSAELLHLRLSLIHRTPSSRVLWFNSEINCHSRSCKRCCHSTKEQRRCFFMVLTAPSQLTSL